MWPSISKDELLLPLYPFSILVSTCHVPGDTELSLLWTPEAVAERTQRPQGLLLFSQIKRHTNYDGALTAHLTSQESTRQSLLWRLFLGHDGKAPGKSNEGTEDWPPTRNVLFKGKAACCYLFICVVLLASLFWFLLHCFEFPVNPPKESRSTPSPPQIPLSYLSKWQPR